MFDALLDQAVDEGTPQQLLPARAKGLPHQDLGDVLLVGEREHCFHGTLGLEDLELAPQGLEKGVEPHPSTLPFPLLLRRV